MAVTTKLTVEERKALEGYSPHCFTNLFLSRSGLERMLACHARERGFKSRWEDVATENVLNLR